MSQKIYYPNLDAIRAISALLVFVSHVELIKSLNSFGYVPSFFVFGEIGVSIFFALSGFLITTLLLRERAAGSVNIRKFYMRRILRIWPLYFLVLIAGICIFYDEIGSTAILLSIFFLPNVAFLAHLLPGLIDPIWSLGVEEQFYIVHPHFFRMKSMRALFYSLSAVFLALVIMKVLGKIWHWEASSEYFHYSRYDCMLAGGILAFFARAASGYKDLLPHFIPFQWVFSKAVQVFSMAVILGFIGIGLVHDNWLYHTPFAIAVGILLSNFALNPKCIFHLEHPTLNWIGKISYGFYLTHKFPITFLLFLTTYFQLSDSPLVQAGIYIISLILSLILAYVLFNRFEKFFLRLKHQKFEN